MASVILSRIEPHWTVLCYILYYVYNYTYLYLYRWCNPWKHRCNAFRENIRLWCIWSFMHQMLSEYLYLLVWKGTNQNIAFFFPLLRCREFHTIPGTAWYNKLPVVCHLLLGVWKREYLTWLIMLRMSTLACDVAYEHVRRTLHRIVTMFIMIIIMIIFPCMNQHGPTRVCISIWINTVSRLTSIQRCKWRFCIDKKSLTVGPFHFQSVSERKF